jgi:integrase
LIVVNPVRDARERFADDLTRGTSGVEPIVFTDAELDASLARLERSPFLGPIVLAAETGARISEVLGVRWADLNLTAATVTRNDEVIPPFSWLVSGQLDGSTFRATKTKRSRSSVALSEPAVEMLRTRRGDRIVHGFVFTTRSGLPVSRRNTLRAWHRAQVQAGVVDAKGKAKGGLHTLRHTLASRLAHRDVNYLIVCDVLRHANPSITLSTYTHLWGDREERVERQREALAR